MNPVIRFILAFLAGFLAMAIVVMIGFGAGPMILGVDRVFDPGTYEASLLWQGIAAGIAVVAASVGGAVAMFIGRRFNVVYAILVVAVLAAIAGAFVEKPLEETPPARPADMPLMEVFQNAAQYSREPMFTKISKPIATAAGLLLGGWMARPRRREDDAG